MTELTDVIQAQVAEDSIVGRLAGHSEIDVNSYHHQAVGQPGKNLRAVAFANDGVVEAVEDTRLRFQLNVSEELACESLAYRLERLLAG